MKLFLVVFFVGCASASFQDASQKTSNDVIKRSTQDQDALLHLDLGAENNDVFHRFERDLKEELENYIRGAFDKAFKTIEDAIKNGKEVHPEAVERLKELKKKMKDLNIMDHEFEGIKEQLDDHLRRILEKLGLLDKTSVEEDIMQAELEDFTFRDFLIKLKKMILEKMDVDTLKKALTKFVGQATTGLCRWITNKGKEKVLTFFDRALETDEPQPEKRSVSDLYQQIKEFLKDLDIEVPKNLIELKKKLKDFGIQDNEFEGIKEHIYEYFRRILKEMGVLDKRSIEDYPMQSVFENLNLRNFFIRLKDMILEKMDVGNLKNSLSKFVGQTAQGLCEWVTNKGQEKLLNFFDRALDADVGQTQQQSATGLYEHIKEFFNDLDIELEQKYLKFGNWVKNILEESLDKSKSKIENIRTIAKNLLHKSENMSKEVAEEALGFMREYKHELGTLYESVKCKMIERMLGYRFD